MPYDMQSDMLLPDGPPQDMRPFHQKLVDLLMMRGQPQDILLPSEGQVDPRIPNPSAQHTKQAFDAAQQTALGDNPALAGLRRIGR